MRRLMGILLLLALLPGLCAADGCLPPDDTLSALCLVAQNDTRYKSKVYHFNNAPLSERGCGPCALTNLVIAALGVDEQETADLVLREMLDLLSGNLDPATHGMNAAHMARLAEIDAALFPTLAERIGAQALTITYSPKKYTPSDFAVQLQPAMASGGAMLAMGKLALQQHWADIIELCQWLKGAGYPDAYVLASNITGGTSSGSGPFRSSGGHFITLLFQPEAYLADGSFYLLDSLPRALADEPYRNRVYWRRYPFTVGEGAFRVFRETYEPIRLQPTALRFRLTEAALSTLQGGDAEAALSARVKYLEQLKVYGEAVVAVYLPARQGTEDER